MSTMLHVVHQFFVLPFFIGEQFIHFSGKGYRLHVICSPSGKALDYSKKMKFSLSEIDIQRSVASIKDIVAIIYICKYIKINKIGIVVGHTPKGAFIAMIAAWILQVPKRIYFRHGLVYETMSGFKKNLMLNIDRLTAFCATLVVCVSPSLYKKSIEDRLNPIGKQRILNKGTCTGIDTLKTFNPTQIQTEKINRLRNILRIEEDSYVIGYCGRLVRDKGIIELVEAFNILEERFNYVNFKLLLVGGFEERDSLPMEIIHEIKNHHNILDTGWMYEGLEYYYALMDVFVLPSFREGFPTSVLEASSMNLPVITTKVTGCVDSIKEDITGKFVDNDSTSVADTIGFYINNPIIGKAHGKNGREFVVKNFDQQIIWEEIERLYSFEEKKGLI